MSRFFIISLILVLIFGVIFYFVFKRVSKPKVPLVEEEKIVIMVEPYYPGIKDTITGQRGVYPNVFDKAAFWWPRNQTKSVF